jgi:hypothetical protein
VKLGKHISTHGLQLFAGSVALTSGAITAMIMPTGGISGQAPGASNLWADIYGVHITSNDSGLAQAVTLSDGTNTVTWQVGTPINDHAVVPYRFLPGVPLIVSAGAVTSGKSINVNIRGVLSKT